MNKQVLWLVVAVVGLSVLTSAGPTIIGIVHAAVPLVIAVGVGAAALRLVWHFANRY